MTAAKIAKRTGYNLFQNLIFLGVLFIGFGGLNAIHASMQPEEKPDTFIMTPVEEKKDKAHNRKD